MRETKTIIRTRRSTKFIIDKKKVETSNLSLTRKVRQKHQIYRVSYNNLKKLIKKNIKIKYKNDHFDDVIW